ncbi:heavy metal-binding domain-containing protein [Hymenobacter rigui]|uniref:Heavy metal binding domain-containing protein n=1 Tax=Hymenobacter rigui TaxID=334424 RepID=A0A3R9NZU0_9BACT|nr:heavy metal-binding domain-containing protein [Hymenobacter rigui]RSK45506.1 hypothetical protein EI291_18085 [Hymenobacter rigui]
MHVFRSLLASLVFLVAAPLAAHAQQHAEMAAGETHAHVAPHGGVVRSASPYHLELVAQPTELAFYLLGAKMSPVPNKGMKGSVMVQQTNNATTTLPLTLAGDDHLTAKLPAGAKVRTAIVTLTTADSKTMTVRFEKLDEARGHQAVGAAYTCPMHPDVAAAQPGKCPKCGMALVKKS